MLPHRKSSIDYSIQHRPPHHPHTRTLFIRPFGLLLSSAILFTFVLSTYFLFQYNANVIVPEYLMRPPPPLTLADITAASSPHPSHRQLYVCPVYTYTTVSSYDTSHVIELWHTYWRTHGYEPIVLTHEDAERHPLYPAYLTRVKQFPKQNADAAAYDLRWLAFEQAGGGLYMDSDLLFTGDWLKLGQMMQSTECGRALPIPTSGEYAEIADSAMPQPLLWPLVTASSPSGVRSMIQHIMAAEIRTTATAGGEEGKNSDMGDKDILSTMSFSQHGFVMSGWTRFSNSALKAHLKLREYHQTSPAPIEEKSYYMTRYLQTRFLSTHQVRWIGMQPMFEEYQDQIYDSHQKPTTEIKKEEDNRPIVIFAMLGTENNWSAEGKRIFLARHNITKYEEIYWIPHPAAAASYSSSSATSADESSTSSSPSSSSSRPASPSSSPPPPPSICHALCLLERHLGFRFDSRPDGHLICGRLMQTLGGQDRRAHVCQDDQQRWKDLAIDE